MRTYASSRVKRKSFYRKSELQMFLLISGGHIGAPKRYSNMNEYNACIQSSTKVRETFRRETVGHKGLRVGIGFFHWTDSNWLFFLRDSSENDLL